MNNSKATKKSNLRVLMYHRTIQGGTPDLLTVTSQQLEDQFVALKNAGYNCVSLKQILDHIEHGTPLFPNSLLLTFDDGYKNNLSVLYPLLKKHGLKAVIFLVPGYVELANNAKSNDYLSLNEVQSIDPDVIEYGLHTFDHKSYNSLSITEIDEDIEQVKKWFHTYSIKYQPVHAYTYGEFPKGNKRKLNELFQLFEKHGIKAAFNIGNRINTLPIQNKFVVQRIDVRGTESITKFISKVKTGKPITGLIKDILAKP